MINITVGYNDPNWGDVEFKGVKNFTLTPEGYKIVCSPTETVGEDEIETGPVSSLAVIKIVEVFISIPRVG